MSNNFQRIDRISEEVRREVDRIIREELNDPRIAGTFSITRAEVTRDLRFAKIFVSVLEDDKRDDMLKALKSAAGYIRRELARGIVIRQSPELSFVKDENIAYGVHIAKVLADVQKTEGMNANGTDPEA
ncbi:MAG: 30S ribosome-binding factor RbfA [Clostridia bacterium]|nr:30S ribosome-binding factor RbfA [Clostridia bacterium]MBQ7305804.1 30S ribosome-binding factor RbfA [Clostridia bacterium]MBQ7845790.1 30S ribosome-binding factor RbfA [Clostridia bacterium]MBQ7865579.1 30S ribosome-binding factor RbfA [Clostridia bacterium]